MHLLDWLEYLPPAGLFFATLGLGLVLASVILVVVRTISRALGVAATDVLAVRDSLITSLSAIFALMVAFSAAGIWNDWVQARGAVQREANALENSFALACDLPNGVRQDVRGQILRVAHRIIEHDWPVMMHLTHTDDVLNEPSAVVALISRISTRGADGALLPQANMLLTQLYDLRSARVQREMIARAGVSPVQWAAMMIIASAALVLIALSYNHDLRLRLTTAGIYLVAVSAAFFVVIAHDTPFVGYLAIKPIPIEQAMQRMENEMSRDPAPEQVRAPSVASDTRDR
jgi:hypothetical protein